MDKQELNQKQAGVIDEPTHWVKVRYADDPESDNESLMFPDELVKRFPITGDLMKSDPDFHLSYIVGLMEVEIRPTYWNC